MAGDSSTSNSGGGEPTLIDASVPHLAWAGNYWLGGNDRYQPACRVVYVDDEPIVPARARAPLVGTVRRADADTRYRDREASQFGAPGQMP